MNCRVDTCGLVDWLQMESSVRRIRSLAVSGLAASLAAIVVLAMVGAGAVPAISLGGLALAAVVFGWLVVAPERAVPRIAASPQRRSLPGPSTGSGSAGGGL